MKEFVLNTLLSTPVTSVDDVPSVAAVQAELEHYAPNVLASVKGMCGISRNKDLSPQAFGAICLIANARSKFCNKFQKFVAFLLMRSKEIGRAHV